MTEEELEIEKIFKDIISNLNKTFSEPPICYNDTTKEWCIGLINNISENDKDFIVKYIEDKNVFLQIRKKEDNALAIIIKYK